MAIEILLYGITALIVINGLAVLMAGWVVWKSGHAEEYKRQYWRAMLEKAQKEMERQEREKNEPKRTDT